MKKILFIVPFLLLFLFPFRVSANEFGDINVTIPEVLEGVTFPYYTITQYGDDIELILTEKKGIVTEPGRLVFTDTNYVVYKWNNNVWNRIANSTGSPLTKTFGNRIIIYNNYDILDSDGNVVFQKAPIKVSFIDTMKTVKMGATMTTVVSLIPLLILLLASLMGFRKAWAWLSKVLRKA